MSLFLEETGFTYLLADADGLKQVHDLSLTDREKLQDLQIDCHAYKVHFLNAQKPTLRGNQKANFYHSYFLGNDAEKWASKVPLYQNTE